jgi:Alpha/beta hydrolase domain
VSNDLDNHAITLQRSLAELQGIPVSELAPVGCTHQQFVNGPSVGVPGVVDPNTYPFSNVANAAFADLTKWVDHGVPPPHAPRIDVTSTGAIVRDGFGNALGGLRTPFVDVPTATYSPIDTVAHQTMFSGVCILYGYNRPFSQSTLGSLYRSHGQYAARVVRESNRLVREGFWLRPDVREVIKQAAHADVP